MARKFTFVVLIALLLVSLVASAALAGAGRTPKRWGTPPTAAVK